MFVCFSLPLNVKCTYEQSRDDGSNFGLDIDYLQFSKKIINNYHISSICNFAPIKQD